MKEIERAYLAKVTNTAGYDKASTTEEHEQYSIKAPIGKVRVRKTTKNGESVYTMTVKTKDGASGNIETPMQIEPTFFAAFATAAGHGEKKTRFTFPSQKVTLTYAGKTTELPGIIFEVDRYVRTDGHTGQFVKIDVELQSVVKYIKDNGMDIDKVGIKVDFTNLPLGITSYWDLESTSHRAQTDAFFKHFAITYGEAKLQHYLNNAA